MASLRMCKARQKSSIAAHATVRNYFFDLPLRQNGAIEKTIFFMAVQA
jgi:hypothetical protein